MPKILLAKISKYVQSVVVAVNSLQATLLVFLHY